jgi:hypothetical protein
MESYYCALRLDDDVADGHHPIPQGYSTRVDYIEDKIAFAKNPGTPKDASDQVLQYCYQVAAQLGFCLKMETQYILESLLFDAKRRLQNIVYPKSILDDIAFKRDAIGTTVAELKIFGEPARYWSRLQPLAEAAQTGYTINDYDTDVLRDGLCNISAEDKESFGISDAALRDPNSPAVQRWLQHQAQRGQMLLNQHQENMKSMSLRRLTRFTLERAYAIPAQEVFDRVMKNSRRSKLTGEV